MGHKCVTWDLSCGRQGSLTNPAWLSMSFCERTPVRFDIFEKNLGCACHRDDTFSISAAYNDRLLGGITIWTVCRLNVLLRQFCLVILAEISRRYESVHCWFFVVACALVIINSAKLWLIEMNERNFDDLGVGKVVSVWKLNLQVVMACACRPLSFLTCKFDQGKPFAIGTRRCIFKFDVRQRDILGRWRLKHGPDRKFERLIRLLKIVPAIIFVCKSKVLVSIHDKYSSVKVRPLG